eukprot:g40750.t1
MDGSLDSSLFFWVVPLLVVGLCVIRHCIQSCTFREQDVETDSADPKLMDSIRLPQLLLFPEQNKGFSEIDILDLDLQKCGVHSHTKKTSTKEDHTNLHINASSMRPGAGLTITIPKKHRSWIIQLPSPLGECDLQYISDDLDSPSQQQTKVVFSLTNPGGLTVEIPKNKSPPIKILQTKVGKVRHSVFSPINPGGLTVEIPKNKSPPIKIVPNPEGKCYYSQANDSQRKRSQTMPRIFRLRQ